MFPRGWARDLCQPHCVIKVCYFFQTQWVKIYTALPWVTLALSYIWTNLIALFDILAEKLYTSMLVLQQNFLVECKIGLWKYSQIVLHWAYVGICWLLRYIWKHPGKALLRLCHWGYYVMVICFQEDAFNIILRTIQYHLLFSFVLNTLDWIEDLIYKVSAKVLQFLLNARPQGGPTSCVETCYISLLPSGALSLYHQRISRRLSTEELKIFQRAGFRVGSMNTQERIRFYNVGSSGGVFFSKTYFTGVNKEESDPTPKEDSSSYELTREIKITFVTFFLLYLYDTFPIVKIIK